ncbi:MAG: hypothetical protein H7144_14410 [Burkholderiales bacterium]|nr:hypothetical protein [Phycisphaerae bacterium]
MRTIHIHRILALAAILATVGSFLIDLRGIMPWSATVPIETSGPAKTACDPALYEPVLRELRAQPRPADAGRFKLLGADPYFTYYYDYDADVVACVVQLKPKGPLVEGSRLEAPDHTRRNVIVICVIVIVLSGSGLRIIQMVRAGQGDK